MRSLEIALVFVNAVALASAVALRGFPTWMRSLTGLAVVVMIVQAVVEGPRWHLYPAYLVTAGLALSSYWFRNSGAGYWTGAAGLVCLVGAAALGTIFPVFDFPMPTGPFAVGTVVRHLVDTSRTETRNGRPSEERELMVQIWYPAALAGPRQPYRSRAETPLKKEHLTLVRTHASYGVPLASATSRYPVLIFSPSWKGRRSQNTFQVEELASHGFIVAAIDHPYGTDLTTFPDGRVARTTLGDWMDFSSDQALAKSIRTDSAELEIRCSDARFVLDELERIDKNDSMGLLTGALDVTRVGIWGHSFGGAVAAESCRTDSRFKAGIDLDGVLFGESAASGVVQPFLFMDQAEVIPPDSALAMMSPRQHRHATIYVGNERNIRRSLSAHGGYRIHIQGTKHMDFSDSPLFCKIKRLVDAGPISATRALRIINEYTVAFFKQYLMAQPQALLQGPSPLYPEVQFEVWRPPAPRPG